MDRTVPGMSPNRPRFGTEDRRISGTGGFKSRRETADIACKRIVAAEWGMAIGIPVQDLAPTVAFEDAVQSVFDALSRVPDFRDPEGKQIELKGTLALAVLAMTAVDAARPSSPGAGSMGCQNSTMSSASTTRERSRSISDRIGATRSAVAPSASRAESSGEREQGAPPGETARHREHQVPGATSRSVEILSPGERMRRRMSE